MTWSPENARFYAPDGLGSKQSSNPNPENEAQIDIDLPTREQLTLMQSFAIASALPANLIVAEYGSSNYITPNYVMNAINLGQYHGVSRVIDVYKRNNFNAQRQLRAFAKERSVQEPGWQINPQSTINNLLTLSHLGFVNISVNKSGSLQSVILKEGMQEIFKSTAGDVLRFDSDLENEDGINRPDLSFAKDFVDQKSIDNTFYTRYAILKILTEYRRLQGSSKLLSSTQVMQIMKGENIDSIIRNAKALNSSDIITYTQGVGYALARAQEEETTKAIDNFAPPEEIALYRTIQSLQPNVTEFAEEAIEADLDFYKQKDIYYLSVEQITKAFQEQYPQYRAVPSAISKFLTDLTQRGLLQRRPKTSLSLTDDQAKVVEAYVAMVDRSVEPIVNINSIQTANNLLENPFELRRYLLNAKEAKKILSTNELTRVVLDSIASLGGFVTPDNIISTVKGITGSRYSYTYIQATILNPLIRSGVLETVKGGITTREFWYGFTPALALHRMLDKHHGGGIIIIQTPSTRRFEVDKARIIASGDAQLEEVYQKQPSLLNAQQRLSRALDKPGAIYAQNREVQAGIIENLFFISRSGINVYINADGTRLGSDIGVYFLLLIDALTSVTIQKYKHVGLQISRKAARKLMLDIAKNIAEIPKLNQQTIKNRGIFTKNAYDLTTSNLVAESDEEE